MREQLKLLEVLQQHDARLQEMEAIRSSLPKKLAAAQAAIAELQKILDHERAELAENESFRKEQEDGHRDSEAQLSKAKSKLAQVRNLKESSAVQKELEVTRRQLDSREEEVAKLSQALSDQRSKIAEQEAKLSQDRVEMEAQEAEVHKRLSDMEAQIIAARAAREQAAKQIRPDMLKRYSTIRLKRGLAIVPVKDGTCRGCNMNIPPQLYNILQRGTSLELCPNCNRIIYWAKLLEEEQPSS